MATFRSQVQSVLRTELLNTIPENLTDACTRHGCTAGLIIWHIVKQLILPPDMSDFTVQKEILTLPTKHRHETWIRPRNGWRRFSTDSTCALRPSSRVSTLVHWLHLSLTDIETLSAVIQYCRTIGNIWNALYTKHQLQESDNTLDRVYTLSVISEFLIELKLNEEQRKITQTVTGATNTQKKPTAFDEYVKASKGKVQKGKGKGAECKGNKQNWLKGPNLLESDQFYANPGKSKIPQPRNSHSETQKLQLRNSEAPIQKLRNSNSETQKSQKLKNSNSETQKHLAHFHDLGVIFL